jgi:hypothetical protein
VCSNNTTGETKKKHAGGRPTTFRLEYSQALIDWFDVEPFEEVPIEHYKQGAVSWTDSKRVPNRLPTLRGFAKSIQVPISTIYDWLNKEHASYHEEFSDAFTHALEIRKDFLIENGLQGLYPSGSFVFVATNLTDMRNKQDVEHSGDINVTVIDYANAESTGFNPDGSKRVDPTAPVHPA